MKTPKLMAAAEENQKLVMAFHLDRSQAFFASGQHPQTRDGLILAAIEIRLHFGKSFDTCQPLKLKGTLLNGTIITGIKKDETAARLRSLTEILEWFPMHFPDFSRMDAVTNLFAGVKIGLYDQEDKKIRDLIYCPGTSEQITKRAAVRHISVASAAIVPTKGK